MLDPDIRKRQSILVSNGIAQFIAIAILFIQPWHFDKGFMTLAPVGRDFVNFWLGGHLAIIGKLDLLASLAGYNEVLLQMFPRDPKEVFLFSYPPHLLLFLVPFGAINHLASVLIWTALNLFCIERTVRLLSPDRRLALIACLSPAVLMMVAFGHFTGVLALLATYILVRGQERPVLGGMCLALITVKPQLALTLGFFLICVGYWRVVLVSVPATLALLGASILAFGIKPWANFFEWTLPLHGKIVSEFYYGSLLVMISVYCGARLVGLSGWAANGIQGVFSAVVLTKASLLFRRRGVDARTIAIGLFAAVGALPYFNCYDLAIFAPALTVALFAQPSRDEKPFLPLVPAALIWLAPMYAIPFGMLGWAVVPWTVALILILLLFQHDGARAAETPAIAAEPNRSLDTRQVSAA